MFEENQLGGTLICGEKYSIFGNIEEIKKFHENKFLTDLINCNEDVSRISNVFLQNIQVNIIYVIYFI